MILTGYWQIFYRRFVALAVFAAGVFGIPAPQCL
jgi:hypothetical protein